MPSWIKLDVVSRLIFELIVCYIRYWNIFVGLTPVEKSQIQIEKVLRWTHTIDEGRHNSRIAKKKEGCHKIWSMIKALTPWSCILLSSTNYQESKKDWQEKSMQRSALSLLKLRSWDIRKKVNSSRWSNQVLNHYSLCWFAISKFTIPMSLSWFTMPIFKNQIIRWKNKINPIEISNCE